jgi:hypothetical protein
MKLSLSRATSTRTRIETPPLRHIEARYYYSFTTYFGLSGVREVI